MTKVWKKLQQAAKVRKVVKAAINNSVSCSICGHGVRSHKPPGWEIMSVWEIEKLMVATIPIGTRQFCKGTICEECVKND